MSTDRTGGERANYRHGDLRRALLAAGVDLARVGGPTAIVLREATRRAGVSPNAAYRHFADRAALLGAVCDAAQSALATAIEAEQDALPAHGDRVLDARARFQAVGTGYIRFARAEPGRLAPAPADGEVWMGTDLNREISRAFGGADMEGGRDPLDGVTPALAFAETAYQRPCIQDAAVRGEPVAAGVRHAGTCEGLQLHGGLPFVGHLVAYA